MIITSFLLNISSIIYPSFMSQSFSLKSPRSFFVTFFQIFSFSYNSRFSVITGVLNISISGISCYLLVASASKSASLKAWSKGSFSCMGKSLHKQSATRFSFPFTYSISYLYSSSCNLHFNNLELWPFTLSNHTIKLCDLFEF